MLKSESFAHFRKELELHGGSDSDSDEDNAGAEEGVVGCLGFSRRRSKVAPGDNAQEVYEKAGTGADDEQGKLGDPQGLVALKKKIENHTTEFEEKIKDITDEGDLFEKLDKQNRIMWLRFLSRCLFLSPGAPLPPSVLSRTLSVTLSICISGR